MRTALGNKASNMYKSGESRVCQILIGFWSCTLLVERTDAFTLIDKRAHDRLFFQLAVQVNQRTKVSETQNLTQKSLGKKFLLEVNHVHMQLNNW